MIITVLVRSISTTAQVSNICLILRHYIRHFKRTARINLEQDYNEMTVGIKIGIFFCLKQRSNV